MNTSVVYDALLTRSVSNCWDGRPWRQQKTRHTAVLKPTVAFN